MRRLRFGYAASLFAFVPGAAFAHPGHDVTTGFAHGVLHPLTGVDHILAMVTVGLFAAHLAGRFGQRALWLVPLSFVSMMVAGAGMAIQGIELPFVETGIALSVVALGAIVALQTNVPLAAAMALTGFFAVFHGHAHGTEMPVDLSGFEYGAGFVAATAALHASGIMLGLGLSRWAAPAMRRVLQVGGAAIALAGLALLSGVIGSV